MRRAVRAIAKHELAEDDVDEWRQAGAMVLGGEEGETGAVVKCEGFRDGVSERRLGFGLSVAVFSESVAEGTGRVAGVDSYFVMRGVDCCCGSGFGAKRWYFCLDMDERLGRDWDDAKGCATAGGDFPCAVVDTVEIAGEGGRGDGRGEGGRRQGVAEGGVEESGGGGRAEEKKGEDRKKAGARARAQAAMKHGGGGQRQILRTEERATGEYDWIEKEVQPLVVRAMQKGLALQIDFDLCPVTEC